MESFTSTSEQLKLKLFVPPPYCKKVIKRENEEVEQIPSLKLIVSNPAKILKLCEKLTDDSSKALEVKINSYLMKEGCCKSAFLVHLLPTTEEAVVQAIGTKELETALYFPVATNVINLLVQYENKALNCDDSLDPQLATIFNKICSDSAPQIISVPVLNRRHKYFPCATQNLQPILLTCFVDSSKDESYLIKLAGELFRYCQTLLLNTMAGEDEERRRLQKQSLLSIARKLFAHLEDVNNLFKEILSEAKKLTNAQRCSLFLLNPDQVQFAKKVFDVTSCTKINTKVKLARDQNIAGYVATTGQLLNIENPYDHPLFDKNVDEIEGVKTRNVLCFPMVDENGVIGVIQLCNKRNGNFNRFDEEVVKLFGVYCGLSVMHSLIYKKAREAHIRSKLANEVMIYNVKVDDEDVLKKTNCPFIHMYPEFDQFNFSSREIIPTETVCLVLLMCEDLGFFSYFSIKKDILARFIMLVQENYRDVPYHNWMHAFSVTHFAYLCLKKFQLVEQGYISNLEALAYFISCLCHDIDHRGINNPFQERCYSVLASLYSSQGSVMERHHVSLAFSILNAENCNFLEPLDRQNYNLCLNLMKDLILATDVATHFKFYKKQYIMTQEGYDKDNAEHRYVLASLLMTCANFADQTKDWPVIKKVTQDIFEEFFTLSGSEKNKEKEPILTTNKDQISIPDLQIQFLKDICLPAFKILGVFFTQAKELIHKVKVNILCWETSKRIFKKATDEGRSPTEVLAGEELEKKVQELIQFLEKEKEN